MLSFNVFQLSNFVPKTFVFGTHKLAVCFEIRFWDRIIPHTNLNIGTTLGGQVNSRVFNIYNGATSQNYWHKAQLKSLSGDKISARTYYDSLKIEKEMDISKNPEYFTNHVWLGIAYAGLGLVELVNEEAEIAQELMPYTKNALSGTVARFDILKIYILTGNYEKAIDEIEVLLSIPSDLTVQTLKLDPFYDPLEKFPDFKTSLRVSESRSQLTSF